jgi:hypothetical protein
MLSVSELALQAKEELDNLSSEAPWDEAPGDPFAILLKVPKPPRKPLDHNVGYPDAGMKPVSGIGLFNGFTDVLTAKIICDDAKSVNKVFEALSGPPTRDFLGSKKNRSLVLEHKMRGSIGKTPKGLPAHVYMEIQGLEGKTHFTVLKARNTFRDGPQETIPMTGSLLLTCNVGWTPLGYGKPLQQQVQIELMLRHTLHARWLSDYLGITASDMPKPKVEEEEGVLGAARR